MAKQPRDSGYDLVPENPKAVRKEAPPAQPARTAMGPERICRYCGFSFHGPPKARCPDCAAPMEGVATDQLKFSQPAWLRTVALGLMLMIPVFPAHILAAFLRWTIGPAERAILHVGAALLLVVAVFVATSREPEGQKSALALWARGLTIAALILWIALFLLLRQQDFSPYMRAIYWLICTVMACHVALSPLLGIYFGDLAGRIPDDGLSWHALQGGWVVAAANALLLGLQFLQLTTWVHFMFFTCSFPLIAGELGIFGWAIVTLLRLAGNLRTCAAVADSIVATRQQRTAARAK